MRISKEDQKETENSFGNSNIVHSRESQDEGGKTSIAFNMFSYVPAPNSEIQGLREIQSLPGYMIMCIQLTKMIFLT